MPEGEKIPAVASSHDEAASISVTPASISVGGDQLTKLLDASTHLGDGLSKSMEDEGFLKNCKEVWQNSPECTSLGLDAGANTLELCRRNNLLNEVLSKEELSEMGVGLLKLLNAPDWNGFSVPDILRLTRKVQKGDAQASDTAMKDTKYGTGLAMVWTDDNTASLLNVAEIYQRYHDQFDGFPVSRAVTLASPYLALMLQLKMIDEMQSHAGSRGKRRRGQLVQAAHPAQEKSNGAAVMVPRTKGKPAPEEQAVPIPDGRKSHPQAVMDRTVDWLRLTENVDSNKQRYYRALCTMWTSGKFEWTRNQPIPTQPQIYYWLRNDRRTRPPAMPDKKVVKKQQQAVQIQQALKKLSVIFKARQFDYRNVHHGQLALAKSLETVVLLLELNQPDYKSILLLARVNTSFHDRIVKMEVYEHVKRILQGRYVDIDAQLVLNQLAYVAGKPSSASNASGSETGKQPSSIQMHVDFSRLPISAQEHALKGFKSDFKETIINLGDVLNTERLYYVGEGGFGTVFAWPEKRMALKIFKRPAPLDQVVRDVANEAACFHLASTLSRMSSRGAASRTKLLPFSPLPAFEIAGSTSGAMALPSWGLGDGLYYPALLMELAVSTINLESREMSKSLFSDSMGVVSDEGFVRLASLMKFISEPLASMHALNLAHRDLKEDNILAMRVAPGVDGYIHFNMQGNKWTGRLGDCGKALCFGVEFHVESDTSAVTAIASKRAKKTLETVRNPGQRCTVAQSLQPFSFDEQLNPPADMVSKMGTVPIVIPVRAVHLQNPVAPSTHKKGDSTMIQRKAPQYSGTLTYSPPEAMPPLPHGSQFLTARDYQAGDMWALGIVLANVLGGSGIRMSLLGSHDKMIFAEADDRVIWRKLNKLPVALKEGRVPDQWTEVMDLLRSLTRLNPHERMTAAEVLQHPFLKKADKLPRLYSS